MEYTQILRSMRCGTTYRKITHTKENHMTKEIMWINNWPMSTES